jgi:hypothetical protein
MSEIQFTSKYILRWLYIITVKHRIPHIFTNDNLNYTDFADNYTESSDKGS